MRTTASNDNLVALADARLEREYDDRHRRLMAIARRCDWLSAEDCEDLASDTLIAWYRALRTRGVDYDDTFCSTVLRRQAISKLRRRTWVRAHTMGLSGVEEVGVDPQLDTQVASREQAHEVAALARRVLSAEELRMLWLLACGYEAREIGQRVGVSEREVRTSLQRARRKLRTAIDQNPRLSAPN
jgi:RNA polymerase sigma factor (sigma-70 family)